MPDDGYGMPPLVKGQDIMALPRLPLGATGDGVHYDEDYVRNLAFDHPGCLPIAEIDSAYRGASCGKIPDRDTVDLAAP